MKQLIVFVSISLILATIFGCVERNSSGVVPKGIAIVINSDEENLLGIDTLYVAPGDSAILVVGFTLDLTDYVPVIKWEVGNQEVLKVEVVQSYEGIDLAARVIAIGDSGDVSTVTARDVENNSEKTIVVNVLKWVKTPKDYKYLGTYVNNLYFLSKSPETWGSADATCKAEGGHLVTIRDQAENDFVYNAIADQDTVVWMDVFIPKPAGDQTVGYKPTAWGTGEPFDFTNWASGYPKSMNAWEQYEGLVMNKFGKWENKINVSYFYVLEIEWKE